MKKFNKFLNEQNATNLKKPNISDLQYTAKYIGHILMTNNNDIKTLMEFYNKLNDQQKKSYLDELLQVYDQVVKTSQLQQNTNL